MSVLERVQKVIPEGTAGSVVGVILIIVAGWLAYTILSAILRALDRRAAARAADDAARARSSAIIHLINSLILVGIIFGAGLAIMHQFRIEATAVRAVSAKVLGTVLVAWISFKIVQFAVAAALQKAEGAIREHEHRQRVKTLFLLARNVAKYVITFVTVITLLAIFKINVTPIIAGAGILGLAIGFGAQNLVRDVIAGFFIIAEGQYAVGDLVEIAGVFGCVEQVGLRMTRLRLPNGQLRFFPNGGIANANKYTEDSVSHLITVPVAEDQPEDAISVVRSILDDFEREFTVFVEPPEVAQDRLPTYARVVRITTHAIPGRHSFVEQKLPARLSAALERAGHPLPSGTDVSVALLYPLPRDTR